METIVGTIFKWVVVCMGVGLMFVIGSMAPTVNNKPNSLNRWKIVIAWLPALFIDKVKRWVNDKNREKGIEKKKLKINELFDLKHKLEDDITNLIREFEEKTCVVCKEVALLGKENKVVYLITGEKDNKAGS